jgi:predicted MFS family arabinose efflux permease
LVDSIDLKKILLTGVCLGGSGFLLMSQADSLLQLTLAFSCYVLGQLCYGPVVTNALLIRRYQAECGRALAIAAIGVSLASILLPLMVVALMEIQGWRGASIGIGLLVIIVLGVAVAFFIPSGTEKASEEDTSEATGNQDRWYLRDRDFWIIAINFATLFTLASVVALCYAPHFASLGFSAQQAAMLVGVSGAGGLVGKAGFGLVAERLRQRIVPVLCAMCAVQIAGWFLLAQAQDFYLVVVAVLLVGGTAGAFIPVYPFVNSLYFETDIIGEVSGAQIPLLLPLGLGGPLIAGWVYDTYGGYQWAFMGMGVIAVLVMLLFLGMGKIRQ